MWWIKIFVFFFFQKKIRPPTLKKNPPARMVECRPEKFFHFTFCEKNPPARMVECRPEKFSFSPTLKKNPPARMVECRPEIFFHCMEPSDEMHTNTYGGMQ
jgi:hypothetical protein